MLRYTPAPYDHEIQKRLRFANECVHLIVDNTPDQTPVGERAKYSAALSAVALGHFRAIISLVEGQVSICSAFALLRPLAETIVRAQWIWHCASETEYARAVHRENPCFPGFSGLAVAIDTFRGDGPQHGGMNGELFGVLCGYTHSGMEQISLHAGDNGNIETSVSDETLCTAIDFASAITLRHFIYFCKDHGNAAQASNLLHALDSLVSLQ